MQLCTPVKYAILRIMKLEMKMASVVVCAESNNLPQAGRFADKALGGAEVRSLEDLRRKAPIAPVLIYLTHPDYGQLRSFLQLVKLARLDVVVYYANRLTATDAAQLGKVVGETRPDRTSVVFEAKAAARSVLRSALTALRNGPGASTARTRQLRERFGLTQTELAHAAGVSLRTVQNWEKSGVAGKSRELRDLAELSAVLKRSMKSSDVPSMAAVDE